MVEETVTNWNDMLIPLCHKRMWEWQVRSCKWTPLKTILPQFFNPPSIATCYPTPTPTHTHPHTCPSPLPFGVGDEYSRRNQVERGPSGLLELISQVGDSPIPVFNHLAGSCLSSACAFSLSQAMASSSKYILQWYSCLLWHSYPTLQLAWTHMAKFFADALQSNAC